MGWLGLERCQCDVPRLGSLKNKAVHCGIFDNNTTNSLKSRFYNLLVVPMKQEWESRFTGAMDYTTLVKPG